MNFSDEKECRSITLIEMLVVLALIGMLTSMVSVAIIHVRRLSIQVECQEHLRQIGTTLNQIMLGNSGAYPELVDDDGFPWWANVYMQWEGASSLDTDSNPENGLQLPSQLPALMQAFHCRMAGALDPADLSSLDSSISYGLNFDVKDSDNHAYHATDHADPYSTRFPDSLTEEDKYADRYYYTEIESPAEFVLISEADTDDRDHSNWTGGRIASEAAESGEANDLHPARIVGRHSGRANILFADMHVEVREVEGEHAGNDVNYDTALWTLPDD